MEKNKLIELVGPAKASAITENKKVLQSDPESLKVVSFDSQTGTKSFIDETAKATEFGMVIKNPTSQAINIVFTAGVLTGAMTFGFSEKAAEFSSGGFKTGADLLTRTGGHTFLGDGTIAIEKFDGSPDKNVTVTTVNSRRKVNEILRYASNAPFRFTKFIMSSYKLDTGAKESSNFNNMIKSVWMSPFEDTIEQEFSIRSVVRDRFQEQDLEIDFQLDAPNLHAIVSSEHAMVFTINPNTMLHLNTYIGARLSTPQQFYRIINKADDVMRVVKS